MARFYLHYLGELVELSQGQTLLGRGLECSIRFDDVGVSRRHLLFDVDGDDISIEDKGSTNGTIVNGQPVCGRISLQDGDLIQVGRRNLTLEVVSERESDWRDSANTVVEHVSAIRAKAKTDKIRATPVETVLQRETRKFIQKSAPSDDDRRRHDRTPVSFPVRYSSACLEVDTMATDLSLSGVFVRTDYLDVIGTSCRLTVQTAQQRVELVGRVCRVVERDPSDDAGLGIEFTNVDTEAYHWLSGALSRRRVAVERVRH